MKISHIIQLFGLITEPELQVQIYSVFEYKNKNSSCNEYE